MPRVAVVLAFLAAGLVACGPPVTVRRVSPQDVYARDAASILDEDERTRFTDITLHRTAISEEDDRRTMLVEMHRTAAQDGERDSLLALAELSFLEGRRTRDASYYLGAAVYAYMYLFGFEEQGPKDSAWDPRTRIAADLYNRALARAFESRNGDLFLPEAGVRRLPVGQIEVKVPRTSIRWRGGVVFDKFLPADVFEVDGLAARYRVSGLGAPLIAQRGDDPGDDDLFPPELDVPATAFLFVEGDFDSLRRGHLKGTLEIYDPFQTRSIEVAGQSVPLEAQPTTAYAHLLGDSPLWDFELAGFFSGSDETIKPGITLLEPYRPDAIPVIFVHGTASSPARWAGLFNDLNNDPVIKEKFQFWFFAYNSGNPIAYSAAQLREAIARTQERLDPGGDDLASRDRILIGHSQGGLLARLAISDTTDFDWKAQGMQAPDEMDLDDETRALLEDVMIFEPVPGVHRVVFIATPHRGSYVAGGWIGRMGAGLITVSSRVLKVPFAALQAPLALVRGAEPDAEAPVPTAVDNMAPDSRFNRLLQAVPMSPDVSTHSIIAVQGAGPVELGNDGVVAYESAHLDDVESEVVVHSGHSVQSNPLTVREVRRILLEHVDSATAPPPPAGAPPPSPSLVDGREARVRSSSEAPGRASR